MCIRDRIAPLKSVISSDQTIAVPALPCVLETFILELIPTIGCLAFLILGCSPNLLINKQSEFAKTGGIHASALISDSGDVISSREDVGRHNALDKLIGHTLNNKTIDPKKQFIACSGRLNFELVQKGLMVNIGLMAGVGAPTSLAIDLAKRYDMTLLGFVKENSFNIYSNINRVILKN